MTSPSDASLVFLLLTKYTVCEWQGDIQYRVFFSTRYMPLPVLLVGAIIILMFKLYERTSVINTETNQPLEEDTFAALV